MIIGQHKSYTPIRIRSIISVYVYSVHIEFANVILPGPILSKCYLNYRNRWTVDT